MIPPEIQVELDKLRTKIADLERQKRNAVTQTELDRAIDNLRSELRPELDALKRRAG